MPFNSLKPHAQPVFVKAITSLPHDPLLFHLTSFAPVGRGEFCERGSMSDISSAIVNSHDCIKSKKKERKLEILPLSS